MLLSFVVLLSATVARPKPGGLLKRGGRRSAYFVPRGFACNFPCHLAEQYVESRTILNSAIHRRAVLLLVYHSTFKEEASSA